MFASQTESGVRFLELPIGKKIIVIGGQDMKGKLSIARTAGIILAVIQLILSGILSVQLLKMLPLKYWGIWVIAAAILFLIVLLLQFGKESTGWARFCR